MRFLFWKWRRYPIKRDERGRSLRQQAFELFNKGLRPSQIYKERLLRAKRSTLFYYYEDWKYYGGHISYPEFKRIMKDNPDFSNQLIYSLSKQLHMPVEEVVKRMQKPWGLKQALRGEWPNYGLDKKQRTVESRLKGGLRMMRLAELFQNSPKELAEILQQITFLKAGDIIEISREDTHLICKVTKKGIATTLRLDSRLEDTQ